MPGEPQIAGIGYTIPGSPLAIYEDLILAKLEAGAIPCDCPHPGEADFLYLPDEILCCAECAVPVCEALNRESHECALCPAPATRTSRWKAGHVHASVCLCADCGTLGGGPPSPN
jgi:hypothetical protein